MALTSSYLVSTNRLEEFLTTLRGAQAPEKFTLSFLKDLGFASSNERLFIPMLKALGFLDESGTPTDRYFQFLDDSRWQLILADGIREAYDDLFRLNRNAQESERNELVGKLKSLTRGQYSEAVIGNMARTFEAFCALANFSQEPAQQSSATTEDQPSTDPETAVIEDDRSRVVSTPIVPPVATPMLGTLSYRIEMVLPATRDKAIYDALFRSLREHLG
jgi:hypothetical protein